jgi:hypothetical protein
MYAHQLATSPLTEAYDTSKEIADVSNQAQAAKAAANAAQIANYTGANKVYDPLSQFLTDAESGKRLTYDEGGNVVGSQRGNIGQVGELGLNEIEAQARQADLASQKTTSNVDALSQLLGWNYDPNTAALDSQVYQGDIAGIRGQAAQDVQAGKSAEKGRTSAVEDYLTNLTQGKKNVGEVKTSKLEETDKATKTANEAIDRALETATNTIKNKTEKAKVDNFVKNTQNVIDNLDFTWSQLDTSDPAEFDSVISTINAQAIPQEVKNALIQKVDASRTKAFEARNTRVVAKAIADKAAADRKAEEERRSAGLISNIDGSAATTGNSPLEQFANWEYETGDKIADFFGI